MSLGGHWEGRARSVYWWVERLGVSLLRRVKSWT